jgi:hypothetical protein
MEKQRLIHWPSIFWFVLAIAAMMAFFNVQKLTLLLQTAGFICLGYSSIRLMPADFFSRKLSFSTLLQVKADYRSIDVFIQGVGLLLILLSLVLSGVIHR